MTPSSRRKRRSAAALSDEQFRRLLDHLCAYCGRSKGDRPPVWCVRSHEAWDSKQAALRKRIENER